MLTCEVNIKIIFFDSVANSVRVQVVCQNCKVWTSCTVSSFMGLTEVRYYYFFVQHVTSLGHQSLIIILVPIYVRLNLSVKTLIFAFNVII